MRYQSPRRCACVDSIQFFHSYFAPPPPPTATVCGARRRFSQTEVLRDRAFLSQGQKWRSINVEIVKMVIAEKVEGSDRAQWRLQNITLIGTLIEAQPSFVSRGFAM